MTTHFWQQKTLAEMTDSEFESLCDCCGKCCYHKLIDDENDDLIYTNIPCVELNTKTFRCQNYPNREKLGLGCIKLTPQMVGELDWLPESCAYRLINENKPLPAWHPLLTGSYDEMRAAITPQLDNHLYKINVLNWHEYLAEHPDQQSKE